MNSPPTLNVYLIIYNFDNMGTLQNVRLGYKIYRQGILKDFEVRVIVFLLNATKNRISNTGSNSYTS